jgi:hypothetical protein
MHRMIKNASGALALHQANGSRSLIIIRLSLIIDPFWAKIRLLTGSWNSGPVTLSGALKGRRMLPRRPCP